MENEPVLDGRLVAQGRGDITARLELAKTDKRALNTLLREYMPFIKKCVSSVFFKADERRNNYTEAMLAFIRSVETYKSEEGAFIPYSQTVIRNRLINAALKEAKIKKTFFGVSIFKGEDETEEFPESETARRQYEIACEHENLKMEIRAINTEFDRWGFELSDLVKNCPKQERSRQTCHAVTRKAAEDRALIADMARTRTLPIKKISALSGCSEKTLEKYRRYIVALIVITEGDYPYLRSFLPPFDEPDTRNVMNGRFTNMLFLFLSEQL